MSLGLLVFGACAGEIDDHPPATDEPLACELEIPQAGPSRIRRLSAVQLRNTVRDLFDDQNISVSVLNESDLIPSALAVEKYVNTAALLAPRGVAVANAQAGCSEDRACAEAFVDDFATRAFRRPLLADERDWLLSTFDSARQQFSFDESITMLTQIILQSPQFIYLAPVGTEVDESPGLRQLDDYELAARLSYFLWNTTPDAELLRAAENLELTSGAGQGLREQAERLLASDRARDMAGDFIDSWFELSGGKVHFSLEDTPKDGEIYPEISRELREAMRIEISALMEKTVFDGGNIGDLFTDNSAYVNGPLAELYGVEDGPTGDNEWAWVSLNPEERAGLLTRAAFATVYSNSKVQAPIRRGTFILREVLCYDQPPPPPNVDDRPIEGNDDEGPKTVRQLTDVRTQGGDCQGCHSVINPIGYAFEHYDAIGAFRAEEVVSGLPIDASGVLSKAGSADGPFGDAIELSAALANSEVATDCLTERFFYHALRRNPELLDGCSFEDIRGAIGDTGDFRALLLAIIESDAFLFVNPGAE